MAADASPQGAPDAPPRPRVLALFGPTGVGKTDVALALADHLRAQGRRPVAVAADALQVYRGLETLTGVPTPAEQRRLEHRLVSFVAVHESFSAGRYAQLAHAEIDELIRTGATPIVVGGTGLYLRAALAELDLRPPPPPELRARLAEQLRTRGALALHAELEQAAPATAARIAPTDGHRVVRALELHAMGTLPHDGAESQLWTRATRHPTQLIALTMDREELDKRIDTRVDRMLAGGAREEVLAAVAAGASPTARKALGFEQLLDPDGAQAMKQATRRYARRQLTWLRKLPGVDPIDVTGRDPADVARQILA